MTESRLAGVNEEQKLGFTNDSLHGRTSPCYRV